MIGQVFSHYQIEKLLGSGAMGVVYLGRDLNLGRPVAIKFLAPELSVDEKATTRFLQEARAVSMLDHPNICAIYEIDRSADGRVCIVMAHYAGETLDQRMSTGPLPPATAVDLAIQIVQGLQCAHAQGIVHRDIKPSNIIVTTTGLVKVLDFGLAKLPESLNLTATHASLGTPRYMSPEQVAGGTLDQRADLWSVGVLLYAMLSGRTPFPGESAPGLFFSILNSEPKPLAEVFPEAPRGLQEIIDRALQKDPEARYPDAASMLADLKGVQRRLDPGAAAGPGATPPPQSPMRRAVLIGGTAAALALAATLAWRSFGPGTGGPLRVAVLPAELVAAPDSEQVAAASSAQVGLLRGLISLRGIAATDPAEVKALSGTPVEIARTLSLDELVSVSLESVRSNWQVRLSRLSGSDGRVLWADQFTTPKEDAQLLAEAMASRLIAGYKDHALREGATIPRVDRADFDEMIRLRDARDGVGAEPLTEAQIYQRLKTLCERSPNFLDAQLLHSQWARRMYAVSSDPGYLREAQSAAERARRIAPWDLRAVSRLFRIALDGGRLESADSLIAEMRRIDPANPQILVSESDLANRRGQFDRSIALLREVVRRQPYRVYLEVLADREFSTGQVGSARAHLDTLMRRYPEDPWPRSKMGELELLYGSLTRAESLYVGLLRRGPSTIYLVNLGISRALQGRFEEAAAAYRRALELSPSQTDAHINLAECETYLGQPDAATRHFGLALEILEKSPDPTGWYKRMQVAQCQARLGQRQQAMATVEEALPRSGDNPDALFTSALVYAIAGDRAATIAHARRAIQRGLGARWFNLPPFAWLRDDPEFKAALAADGSRSARR